MLTFPVSCPEGNCFLSFFVQKEVFFFVFSILVFISAVMVMNAFSTLVVFFTDVSRNVNPNSSAKFFAVAQSTTFLVVKSHLFPTRSLFTFSLA